MKKIFTYNDYRKFLRDFYEEKKKTGGFTYRDFSKQAGMNSSSWLLHLIRGNKNLTEKSAGKVAAVLALKKKEIEYFHMLVEFTQAKDSDTKNGCYKKMIALKRRLKLIKITEEQYQYYTRWYHPAVRSLVSKVDFGEDYALLAKKLLPSITPSEARKSVNLLKKLGFIKRDESGKWFQVNAVLSTGDEVSSLNVVNYHKQVSKLAEGAFDRCVAEDRDISALTLGISGADAKMIKTKIQQFRKEIMDIARNSVKDDRVYQLNFQFFPISKWEEQ